MSTLQHGAVFIFAYPFIRESFDDYDDQGDPVAGLRWKPGVRFQDGPESAYAFADALGKQILTVVSTHKPGAYGRRVFYTRQWVDPDGVEFGNKQLRIKGIAAFTKLTRGYSYKFKLGTKASAA